MHELRTSPINVVDNRQYLSLVCVCVFHCNIFNIIVALSAKNDTLCPAGLLSIISVILLTCCIIAERSGELEVRRKPWPASTQLALVVETFRLSCASAYVSFSS